MAQQDKLTFENTFNDATTGLFKDNTTGEIGADGTRTLVTNVADSLLFISDNFEATPSGIGSSTKVLASLYTGSYLKSGTISSAQILTGNSIPVELIPAPGSGLIILPISIMLFYDYNSVAYATNTNLLVSLGVSGITLVSLTGLLANTSDRYSISAITPSLIGADIRNAGIYFSVSGGNPTAGNSPIYYSIVYRIIPST